MHSVPQQQPGAAQTDACFSTLQIMVSCPHRISDCSRRLRHAWIQQYNDEAMQIVLHICRFTHCYCQLPSLIIYFANHDFLPCGL